MFRANPAAILQHGGRQHAARHLRHLVTDAELELLNERVGLVVGAPHLEERADAEPGLSAQGGDAAARLTSLLISSCRSGAERAVALIMVDVWLSVSFLMQRCPATMLHT